MFVTGLQRHCSHDPPSRRLFSFPSLFSSSVSPVSFVCCPARCMCKCKCVCVCESVYASASASECVWKFRDLESGSSKIKVGLERWWTHREKGKVWRNSWRLQEIVTRKSFVIFISWEWKTNRTISRLVPSNISPQQLELKSLSGKRMIGGIWNMLFSICSQTSTCATSSGYFRWTCGAKW